MGQIKYKVGRFNRVNGFQKQRLEDNRSRLENLLVTKGMKIVRYWIFKKIGIKMNPSQVRRFLNYRKHQNRSLEKDIRLLANKAAGYRSSCSPKY